MDLGNNEKHFLGMQWKFLLFLFLFHWFLFYSVFKLKFYDEQFYLKLNCIISIFSKLFSFLFSFLFS